MRNKVLLIGLLMVGMIGLVAVVYWSVLRGISGVAISSWFRWPWQNEHVGGMPFSLHQIGWAWDLVPDGPVTQAQVIATGLPFLKLNPEGSHLHVQIF